MYPFWKVLAGGWEGDMFPVLFSLLAGLSHDSNILRTLVIDGERRNGLHFALAHVFPLRQPVAPSQGGTRCTSQRRRSLSLNDDSEARRRWRILRIAWDQGLPPSFPTKSNACKRPVSLCPINHFGLS